MSAKLLDGKLLAASIRENLKKEIVRLKKETGKFPRVVNIMVGEDPSAHSYANSQKKTAEEIGIDYNLINLPATATEAQLISQIEELNKDSAVCGILVYKPVPKQINYRAVVNHIEAIKDLEGLNATNLGKMVLGEMNIVPCTPAAAMEHLKLSGIAVAGKEAVIVGRSEIVGKPLILLLLAQSATVTVCHSLTSKAGKLIDHLKRADIVVAAVGQPEFVKGSWIKEGAVVIDVGINKVNGKIVGDVEFAEAAKHASFITPVPGGVGPVTAVLLMKNALKAFCLQMGLPLSL